MKELTRSIINCDVTAYGVKEFRISDCIVQLNMDGSDQWLTFINLWQDKGRFLGQDGKCWYGAALNTIVVNSTIYNRYDPSKMKDKAYFLRFANQGIDKVFGSYNGTFDIKNSTICRMTPNKDFGNNIANKPAYVITFAESIFYDTYRLQKVKRGGTYVWSKNFIWGVTKSVDNTDKTEIATEADPGFTAANLDKALDFSQPNGGEPRQGARLLAAERRRELHPLGCGGRSRRPALDQSVVTQIRNRERYEEKSHIPYLPGSGGALLRAPALGANAVQGDGGR